ncbi:hypothetical protein [uncultured Ruthenibacterium sp.]|uniref:hypothetical protein n=1 Tax=uncultured Ruthenibacterium sp. TaxID=1905347 RepID=UPI00349E89FA
MVLRTTKDTSICSAQAGLFFAYRWEDCQRMAPMLAIELDGREHYIDSTVQARDRKGVHRLAARL